MKCKFIYFDNIWNVMINVIYLFLSLKMFQKLSEICEWWWEVAGLVSIFLKLRVAVFPWVNPWFSSVMVFVIVEFLCWEYDRIAIKRNRENSQRSLRLEKEISYFKSERIENIYISEKEPEKFSKTLFTNCLLCFVVPWWNIRKIMYHILKTKHHSREQ